MPGAHDSPGAVRDWLRKRFADCEITLSHGRTGQRWDNALAESSSGRRGPVTARLMIMRWISLVPSKMGAR